MNIVNLLMVIASLIIIAFMICGILWCRSQERKDWNHGICPNCGEKLRLFGTDSQGGEGWVCDKCDYTTWVSYHRYVYEKGGEK